MKRIHLFEFNDIPCLPATWRRFENDFLSFFSYHVNPYKPILNVLNNALRESSSIQIIDLCAGSGHYMLKLIQFIKGKNNKKPKILITDKYPNEESYKYLDSISGKNIQFCYKSIDATSIPDDFKGFRTFFSSFHHFKKEDAQRIIDNAVEAGEGIGIFEYTSRNTFNALLSSIFGTLFLLIFTPLLMPFSWERLLWTYLIPIIPVIFFWDGLVSHFRTYNINELKDLIAGKDSYKWEINKTKTIYGACSITYLVGYPIKSK